MRERAGWRWHDAQGPRLVAGREPQSTVQFPADVQPTPCERRTRSFVGRVDGHGMRKLVITCPADTPPARRG
jgi:hypothetical protein